MSGNIQGLSIGGNTGLNANIGFFYGTGQSTSFFQASNITLGAAKIANFTVTNRQALNSTSQSPITLKISSINQPSDIVTYYLVNGQNGLPQSQSQSQPFPWPLFVSVIIAALALVSGSVILFRISNRKGLSELTMHGA